MTRANRAWLAAAPCQGLDGLTDSRADVLAIHTGWHPLEVWGWAWVTAGLALGHLDPENPDPVPGEGVAT